MSLDLVLANARLLTESGNGRKALTILAGISGQPPICQLGARGYAASSDESFRDENAIEESEGIERFADFEKHVSCSALQTLFGHRNLLIQRLKKNVCLADASGNPNGVECLFQIVLEEVRRRRLRHKSRGCAATALPPREIVGVFWTIGKYGLNAKPKT
jgi:hypothetical protein